MSEMTLATLKRHVAQIRRAVRPMLRTRPSSWNILFLCKLKRMLTEFVI